MSVGTVAGSPVFFRRQPPRRFSRAQSSRLAVFGGLGMSFNICRGTLGSLAIHRDEEASSRDGRLAQHRISKERATPISQTGDAGTKDRQIKISVIFPQCKMSLLAHRVILRQRNKRSLSGEKRPFARSSLSPSIYVRALGTVMRDRSASDHRPVSANPAPHKYRETFEETRHFILRSQDRQLIGKWRSIGAACHRDGLIDVG